MAEQENRENRENRENQEMDHTIWYRFNGLESDYDETFQKREDRHRFIKCVYTLIVIMLAFTAGIVCFFRFYEPASDIMNDNLLLFLIISVAAFFITGSMLGCFKVIRTTFPLNYILVFIFTISVGLLLSYYVQWFENDVVLMAVGCAAAVIIGLTLFACQTKYDFTPMSGFLICAAIVFICIIVASFCTSQDIFNVVIAGAAAIIHSVWIVISTQLVVGKNTKYRLKSDEYFYGALWLYLNMITLFLSLLHLMRFR